MTAGDIVIFAGDHWRPMLLRRLAIPAAVLTLLLLAPSAAAAGATPFLGEEEAPLGLETIRHEAHEQIEVVDGDVPGPCVSINGGLPSDIAVGECDSGTSSASLRFKTAHGEVTPCVSIYDGPPPTIGIGECGSGTSPSSLRWTGAPALL